MSNELKEALGLVQECLDSNELKEALELVQECLDDWPYAALRVIPIMRRLEKVKEILLKERESDRHEIVRCKDCKHRYSGHCYNRKSYKVNFGADVEEDWFCADGERKGEK